MRKGFFPRLAISGIRKNRSIYYPYILTAVLTTAMMYIIGALQQISTDYSGTLAFSLQLGIVVTSVFSVVFLFYTNSFLMRLGFGGPEHKPLRRVLLGHLNGYAAFRSAAGMQAHREKYAQLRRKQREEAQP